MKERPILMSAPMVRAILDGTKTQTRRVVKGLNPKLVDNVVPVVGVGFGQPDIATDGRSASNGHWTLRCPFGVVGDRLWVRETWKPTGLVAFAKPNATRGCGRFAYDADAEQLSRDTMIRWRSSIHMPRWASRITLEVTDVRVQRLQDISEDDARAEGVGSGPPIPSPAWWAGKHDRDVWWTARDSFRLLWGSIYSADAWDANPWVWAVSFRRVTP